MGGGGGRGGRPFNFFQFLIDNKIFYHLKEYKKC